MTVKELKDKLTELEIEFPKKCDKFSVLLSLLPKEMASAADRRKALQEIIEDYKIQNPVKYAKKEKELQKKLGAIK